MSEKGGDLKLNRTKRRAAAKALFVGFSTCQWVANQTLVFNHLEWGDDLLLPNEKEYLEKIRRRIHDDGEALRKLGAKLSK